MPCDEGNKNEWIYAKIAVECEECKNGMCGVAAFQAEN